MNYRICNTCPEVGVTGACREMTCPHWKKWWGGGELHKERDELLVIAIHTPLPQPQRELQTRYCSRSRALAG